LLDRGDHVAVCGDDDVHRDSRSAELVVEVAVVVMPLQEARLDPLVRLVPRRVGAVEEQRWLHHNRHYDVPDYRIAGNTNSIMYGASCAGEARRTRTLLRVIDDEAPDRPCSHCGRLVPQRLAAGRPFRYCRDNGGACQREARNARLRQRTSPGLSGQVARAFEVAERLEQVVETLVDALHTEVSPAGLERQLAEVRAEAAAQIAAAHVERDEAQRTVDKVRTDAGLMVDQHRLDAQREADQARAEARREADEARADAQHQIDQAHLDTAAAEQRAEASLVSARAAEADLSAARAAAEDATRTRDAALEQAAAARAAEQTSTAAAAAATQKATRAGSDLTAARRDRDAAVQAAEQAQAISADAVRERDSARREVAQARADRDAARQEWATATHQVSEARAATAHATALADQLAEQVAEQAAQAQRTERAEQEARQTAERLRAAADHDRSELTRARQRTADLEAQVGQLAAAIAHLTATPVG
jgi:hypothetical protein